MHFILGLHVPVTIKKGQGPCSVWLGGKSPIFTFPTAAPEIWAHNVKGSSELSDCVVAPLMSTGDAGWAFGTMWLYLHAMLPPHPAGTGHPDILAVPACLPMHRKQELVNQGCQHSS